MKCIENHPGQLKSLRRNTSRFWGVGLAAACLCGAAFLGAVYNGEAIAAKPGGTTTVTVSEFRTIAFGTVAGSADGPSTVVLSPAGAITTTGYGIAIKGTVRAGEYKIVGPANANVLITLPATATISNGVSNATLSNFTSSPASVGTLSNKGKLTIAVGATLNLPAGQASGDYTGTFPIFVDLQ
ncbi:DUF4402 domain-containing protein [Pseudomonadota bacterium]